MNVLAVLLLLSVGCRCGQPADPPSMGPQGHYTEWEPLVDAAVRGDLSGVRTMARDLTEGEAVVGDEEAAADLGAALGFLQVADDDSVILGVVRAAEACGGCHEGMDRGRERPAFAHHTAARWAVHGLVWNQAVDPPDSDWPPSQAFRGARDTGGEPDLAWRTSQLLQACSPCHAARSVPEDELR